VGWGGGGGGRGGGGSRGLVPRLCERGRAQCVGCVSGRARPRAGARRCEEEGGRLAAGVQGWREGIGRSPDPVTRIVGANFFGWRGGALVTGALHPEDGCQPTRNTPPPTEPGPRNSVHGYRFMSPLQARAGDWRGMSLRGAATHPRSHVTHLTRWPGAARSAGRPRRPFQDFLQVRAAVASRGPAKLRVVESAPAAAPGRGYARAGIPIDPEIGRRRAEAFQRPAGFRRRPAFGAGGGDPPGRGGRARAGGGGRSSTCVRQCGPRSIRVAAKGVDALCTAAVRRAGRGADLRLFGTLTGVPDPPPLRPLVRPRLPRRGPARAQVPLGREDPQVCVRVCPTLSVSVGLSVCPSVRPSVLSVCLSG
jgi:hypothetical protein